MLKTKQSFLMIAMIILGLFAQGQGLTDKTVPDSLLEYETAAFYVQLSQGYSWGSGEIGSAADERLDAFPQVKQLFENGIILNLKQEFGVLGKKQEAIGRIYRVRLAENHSLAEALIPLEGLACFGFVEKIPLYRTFYTPNDPTFNDPQKNWHLNQINASGAWNVTQGCAQVRIAVVDDAVLMTHEDLAANIFLNAAEIPNNGIDDDLNGYVDDVRGFDVSDMDANANPPGTASATFFTHGTLVAGAASAQTDNNVGIASIGFNTSIIPVKTKSDFELTPGLLTNPMQGVEYAIAVEADVINMSWGSYASSQAHQLVFNYAYSAGLVTVAASGNQGLNFLMYPSAYEHVIAVAASDQTNDGAAFSNVTTELAVFAPGVQIWSCLADGSYGYATGTSLAAPIVSGVAALMLCNDSTFTPEGIRNCIVNSADNYPSTMYPGLTIRVLNAQAAVACPIPFTNTCETEGCELIANGGFEEPSNSSITVYGNFGWAAVAEGQVCSWESYLGTTDVFPNPVEGYDNYAGLYFANYVGQDFNWPSYTEGIVSSELDLVPGQSYTLEFDASMAVFEYELDFDSLFVGLINNSFYYDQMASPPDTFATVPLGAVYNIPVDTLLSSVNDQPKLMDGTLQMSDFFRHYTLTFTMPAVTDMNRIVITPCAAPTTYGYHQLYLDNISIRANLSINALADLDTIEEGNCVNLSALGSGNEFVWEPVDLFNDPVGAIQVSCPDTSTTYIATVYDPVTGCTGSDTVSVYVIPNPELSVTELAAAAVISYPNPVVSELFIESVNTTGDLQFDFCDGFGRIVSHGNIAPGQITIVPIKNLSSGIYTLNISNGQKLRIIKR